MYEKVVKLSMFFTGICEIFSSQMTIEPYPHSPYIAFVKTESYPKKLENEHLDIYKINNKTYEIHLKFSQRQSDNSVFQYLDPRDFGMDAVSFSPRFLKKNDFTTYFKDKVLKIDTDSYRLMEYLGTGSYGHVYKGENINNGNIVALKFLANSMDREDVILEWFEKQGVSFVPKFYGSTYFFNGCRVIAMEYIPHSINTDKYRKKIDDMYKFISDHYIQRSDADEVENIRMRSNGDIVFIDWGTMTPGQQNQGIIDAMINQPNKPHIIHLL
jgi:hypothetical protein